MSTVLQAKERKEFRKSEVKKLRMNGKIPRSYLRGKG